MDEVLRLKLKEQMENHRDSKVNELNKNMLQVFEGKTFPDRYRGLALFYHNTMEQGELGILMLKDFLTNDFFFKNEPKNDCNCIIFYDEDFTVVFSKSLSMYVEIINKDCPRVGNLQKPPSSDVLERKAELESWLTKKDFKTFKKLVKRKEKNWAKNIIAKTVLLFHVYNKTTQADLDEINYFIESIENNNKKYEIQKKLYEENQEKAREFVDSLTDLKIFKDTKWHISCKNIYEKDGKNKYTYK